MCPVNVSHLYASGKKETDLFYTVGSTSLLLWQLFLFGYVNFEIRGGICWLLHMVSGALAAISDFVFQRKTGASTQDLILLLLKP